MTAKYHFQTPSGDYEIESDHDLNPDELKSYAQAYTQKQAPSSKTLQSKASDQTPSMAESLFPRRAKAFKEDGGFIRKGLATSADLASDVLGVPYAAAETLTGDKSFKENLADRQGGSIVKRIANDPATVPTALMTGGGGTIANLTKAGLKQGLASATIHQAENVGEGKDINIPQAATEASINSLLPGFAQKAGQAMKGAGKGFMQSILKPSKFLRETEKVDMGGLIETLGSARPFKGSLKGMANKAEQVEGGLNSQYDEIVSANAKKKVNVQGSLGTTKKGFEDAFTQNKEHGDVIGGLRKGGEYWDDIVQQQGSKGGWYDLPQEVNFRKSVGRAGRYNQNKDPRELEGPTQFARELYNNLTEQETRIVPELGPVKENLSSLYPMQEAVLNAQGRTANNFYPGLTDNIALSAAAQAQKPEMTIPGLALFLANRTVKNPAAATGLYKAGQAAEDPGAAQQAIRAALKRALGQSFREEE